jgi:hypothetical protein
MNKAFSKLAYKIYVLYLLLTSLSSKYEPLPARYSGHMFLMRQRRLIGVGRILRRVEKPPYYSGSRLQNRIHKYC